MKILPPSLRSTSVSVFAIARDNPAQLWRMARTQVLGHAKYRAYFLRPEHWLLGEDEVRKLLSRNLIRHRGFCKQPRWKNEVIEILVKRSQGSIGHAAATGLLRQVAAGLDVKADVTEAYLAFAKASASVGLFEGSYGFVRLAYRRIELDAQSSSDVRDALNAVRVAIHEQDAGAAQERWARLRNVRVPPGSKDGLDMLDMYMSAWARNAVSAPSVASHRDEWATDIKDASVVIVGPAPTTFDISKADDYGFVAQIYRNRELLRFPKREDGCGREILYVGGLYLELKKLSPAELTACFGRFKHFVINSVSSELGLPNTRRADNRLGSLFVRGTPNMVQVMCLDMMVAEAASIHVVGANFYASAEPYVAGDDGGFKKFGFCCAIASHNPTENRALIANLVDAGLVSGDNSFLKVLALSDLEYLKLLDKYYGETER